MCGRGSNASQSATCNLPRNFRDFLKTCAHDVDSGVLVGKFVGNFLHLALAWLFENFPGRSVAKIMAVEAECFRGGTKWLPFQRIR